MEHLNWPEAFACSIAAMSVAAVFIMLIWKDF